MSQRTRATSVNSLSPVSASRLDTADAFDVLNSSIDSSLIRRISQDVFQTDVAFSDSPVAVMEKCRTIIDDLQFELDTERARVAELESTVESLRIEIDAEKKKLREERVLVEELRRDIIHKESGRAALTRDIDEAKQLITEKDRELENMTLYCEKRLTELKRLTKEASCSIASPPLPPQSNEDIRINELAKQLAQSNIVIRSKDTELKSVVDSYEKQVRLLRSQLKTTEDLLSRLSPGVAVPSARIDDAFIDGEFKKLNKTSLTYRGGLNPFSTLN